MPEFDMETRARTAYRRANLLTGISAGAIVFLAAQLDLFQANPTPALGLVVALIGLAFTLFVSTGLQIAASAADRWGEGTVSPALLVWEWRLLALAHFTLMVSGVALVSYLLSNL